MTVPLEAVAVAFSIAAGICVIDIFIARIKPRRIIRLCESIILSLAAGYYIQAAVTNTVPSPDLRFLWLCLAAVIIAEVISRWDLSFLRGRRK
jgi:hypothetical protein